MDFNITGIILFLMILAWQVMMWKKIKLKKWQDYTGVFFVDSNNDEELITNKAVEHYNEYFGNVPFYKDRTLGLFITGPEGKKLVKVLQDKENNLIMGDKN